jgi:hypothetical protein
MEKSKSSLTLKIKMNKLTEKKIKPKSNIATILLIMPSLPTLTEYPEILCFLILLVLFIKKIEN